MRTRGVANCTSHTYNFSSYKTSKPQSKSPHYIHAPAQIHVEIALKPIVQLACSAHASGVETGNPRPFHDSTLSDSYIPTSHTQISITAHHCELFIINSSPYNVTCDDTNTHNSHETVDEKHT
jgi:hypothetical protein